MTSTSSRKFAEVEGRAETVRRRLGLADEPIPEIAGVLERAGLLVVVEPFGTNGPDGIYIRRERFAAVLLNGAKPLTRLRFAGAHELGHHEYRDFQAHVDVDVEKPTRALFERRANAFAAAFLMPKATVGKRLMASGGPDGVTASDALEMAQEFVVSYPTMVRRLNDLSLLRRGARQRDELLGDQPSLLADSFRETGAIRRQLPPKFTSAAIQAYGSYEINLARLAELLKRPESSLRSQLAAGGYLHPEDHRSRGRTQAAAGT